MEVITAGINADAQNLRKVAKKSSRGTECLLLSAANFSSIEKQEINKFFIWKTRHAVLISWVACQNLVSHNRFSQNRLCPNLICQNILNYFHAKTHET